MSRSEPPIVRLARVAGEAAPKARVRVILRAIQDSASAPKARRWRPERSFNLVAESSTLSPMKTVLPLIGALILASACISACPAAVALIQKESTPSSLAETGAKEVGEHAAKGLMSPTPSPTPTAVQ